VFEILGIGIWFLRLPDFTHIFVQFPPFDFLYNLYHREKFWSNTEKSGKEIDSQRILWRKLKRQRYHLFFVGSLKGGWMELLWL